jgi:hypothetical protein
MYNPKLANHLYYLLSCTTEVSTFGKTNALNFVSSHQIFNSKFPTNMNVSPIDVLILICRFVCHTFDLI